MNAVSRLYFPIFVMCMRTSLNRADLIASISALAPSSLLEITGIIVARNGVPSMATDASQVARNASQGERPGAVSHRSNRTAMSRPREDLWRRSTILKKNTLFVANTSASRRGIMDGRNRVAQVAGNGNSADRRQKILFNRGQVPASRR
jgi:hypothetical protein